MLIGSHNYEGSEITLCVMYRQEEQEPHYNSVKTIGLRTKKNSFDRALYVQGVKNKEFWDSLGKEVGWLAQGKRELLVLYLYVLPGPSANSGRPTADLGGQNGAHPHQ